MLSRKITNKTIILSYYYNENILFYIKHPIFLILVINLIFFLILVINYKIRNFDV